ncbi:MAG: pyrroline-5-carboxylate reductase [Clostridiales bacterium]|nr:pyrroline-5-carboxylate reductase [Clostridiales bacterium]
MNIGFIGTGNLANAMIKGVLHAKAVDAQKIYAYDIDPAKLSLAVQQHGINAASSPEDLVEKCGVILLAIKPADFPALLKQLDTGLKAKDPLIISAAAGNSLDYISSFLTYEPVLVRIMPNINATIGEAMSAYCTNGRPTDEQLLLVEKLCSAFGEVIPLDEKYFPMFGVIAGAAPAFAYMFIDELARAGVKIGMNKKLSLQIAAQTVLGSAKYILESGEHPYELIDRVCSPGGTTIEGIAALQEFGFSNAITKAVDRALEKDMKLASLKKNN